MKPFVLQIVLFFASFLLVFSPRNYLLHSNGFLDRSFSPQDDISLYFDRALPMDSVFNVLVKEGLYINSDVFEWARRLSGWKSVPRGHYLVTKSSSLDQLLEKLGRGLQDPISLTILPGKSIESIIDQLDQQSLYNENDFLEVLKDDTWLSKINSDTTRVLGQLYPETYSVYWTDKPKTIISRLIDENTKALSRFIDGDPYTSSRWEEIIIMASIIEWEYRFEEEKKRIGGLYWNRLNSNMRLQADPTVNFALGQRRRLLYKDYSFEHPYNTYQINGLPPGPITNPSYSSLEAAACPERHEYLYMVASPKGTHTFSTSYEDHLKASKIWRDWIQEQYRIKRDREQSSF
tara:strand:- start:5387 stop:6430 length:1044 start_codon:yes stop_codon:yes gene_type:complete